MKTIKICSIIAFASVVVFSSSCGDANGNKMNATSESDLVRIKDSLALDSFKRAEAAKKALAEKDAQTTKTKGNVIPTTRTTEVIYNGGQAAPTIEQEQANEKKGWSDAAKGTAIGAGVGAGVGALIDKDKRGRGAIIGAAIGGGSGYAIGRKSDRESGRVQKK